jgi:hypothetical protein
MILGNAMHLLNAELQASCFEALFLCAWDLFSSLKYAFIKLLKFSW